MKWLRDACETLERGLCCHRTPRNSFVLHPLGRTIYRTTCIALLVQELLRVQRVHPRPSVEHEVIPSLRIAVSAYPMIPQEAFL